jgi:hypothetical protein
VHLGRLWCQVINRRQPLHHHKAAQGSRSAHRRVQPLTARLGPNQLICQHPRRRLVQGVPFVECGQLLHRLALLHRVQSHSQHQLLLLHCQLQQHMEGITTEWKRPITQMPSTPAGPSITHHGTITHIRIMLTLSLLPTRQPLRLLRLLSSLTNAITRTCPLRSYHCTRHGPTERVGF